MCRMPTLLPAPLSCTPASFTLEAGQLAGPLKSHRAIIVSHPQRSETTNAVPQEPSAAARKCQERWRLTIADGVRPGGEDCQRAHARYRWHHRSRWPGVSDGGPKSRSTDYAGHGRDVGSLPRRF